jgi:ABC-2 type transport system permease protein
MKKLMVIMKKDLRETFRTKAFYVSIGMVIFVLVALSLAISGSIDALMKEDLLPAEIATALQPLIGTIAFMLSLMLMMLFCMFINAYSITIEKVKRSIESLLCTPLSLRQIWLGKTLAVFLPSVVLGLVFTFGGIAAINQFFINPSLGYFIMPGAAPLVAILVAVPLVIFFLSSLLIALQLIIANIRWINSALIAAIFIVGFALSPVLRFGPSSWSIVFVSLGVAAILALIAFLLSPRVTKERIILSSKG